MLDDTENRFCNETADDIQLSAQISALKSELENLKLENQKLEQSISKYRSYVENANDIIGTLSLKGVISYISPNVTDITGYEVGEVINQSMYIKFIHPDDIPKTIDAFHKSILSRKKLSEIEYRVRQKDGTWHWHATNASPIYNNKGRITSFLAISRDITERKIISDALTESQTRMKEAQRIGKIGNWEWLPGKNKILWSEEMYHIFNVKAGMEIMTNRPLKYFHPDDRIKILESTKKAIKTRQQQSLECRIIIPGGEIRYIHAKGEVHLDKNRKIEKVIGICQDITERKQAEDYLRESTRKLNTMVNNLKGVVYRCINDGNWTMEYISAGICELSGYPAEDFINNRKRLYSDIIHPDDVKTTWLEIVSAITERRLFTFEYRVIHQDSSIHWVWERGCPIYENDILIAFEGFISDITDRKLAEDMLKANKEQYRLLLDTMREGVVYVDNDDVILYINQSCCDIYDYKHKDLIGKVGYELLIHEDDRHIIQEKNKSRLEGIIDSYEVRGNKASGETIWLRISGAPIKSNTGQVIGSVGLMSDITHRKQLEEQLLAAQKMEAIGQLAGGVAHDFNNLLTVILGYGEELINSLKSDDILRKDAEEIVKAGKRASGLTHQLLTFSRKQVIQPKVMDLNELVSDLHTMLLRLIGEHIKFVTVQNDDNCMVKADFGQIEQVIINLVVNARDAMPTGGKLTIETSKIIDNKVIAAFSEDIKPGQYILLTITDSGCGMDKEILSRVYEPFFTTKKTGKGLGLGLSTVYGIVKQSDGYIMIQSETGIGTSVKILLPVTCEKPETKTPSVSAKELVGHGEHILIVEDEESLCLYIRKMVEKLGYRVTISLRSLDALTAIENGLKPDLIITDVIMPEMNGKELFDKIRKVIPHQKVLFMSGFTDDVIELHGILNRDIPFIQKPFSPGDIAYSIKKLLSDSSSTSSPTATILMIDDDEEVRILVQRSCHKTGYGFTGAGDLPEALAVISEKKFDALVIDLNLVGMNGIEALQEIRKTGCTVPAILFSGAFPDTDKELLKSLGIVATVVKSFDNNQLIRCIGDIVAGETT
jgi:two-component system cell cycle sensor histidine kinase/response regulator CckA